jgi:16S rRNA (adenine1518-N6/adenine1519-N6)-dimethyltransferase
VQTFGEVKKICRVPAGAFFPPPKVESAVIHIRVKTESEIGAFFGSVKSDDYFAVVRSGFVAKRRQLKNSLNQLFLQRGKDPIAVFRAAEVRPSARPEELDLSAWKRLAAALTN